ELLIEFDGSVRHYHSTFQQDVESAAHRLYRKLQEQPLLLNSLRATRVTTDAAVIALALHTGGIGIHDLVIAPSLLTVTSLLAESAIGSYMHNVETDLKKNQLKQVKQELFTKALGDKLLTLPEQLSGLAHFNISPEQLQEAENQLKEKRHGLRLL
ncbi:MAG TPA: GTP-binding protein, partial [Methylomicrobium sp.]|nr:GTP-binding protein [Methylomicrobium sp.]